MIISERRKAGRKHQFVGGNDFVLDDLFYGKLQAILLLVEIKFGAGEMGSAGFGPSINIQSKNRGGKDCVKKG